MPSLPNAYSIGEITRISLEVLTKASLTPVDVTEATLYIVKPDDTAVPPKTLSGGDIAHPSTGNYYFDLLLDTEGTWKYWFVTTGVVVATKKIYLEVNGHDNP